MQPVRSAIARSENEAGNLPAVALDASLNPYEIKRVLGFPPVGDYSDLEQTSLKSGGLKQC